MERITNEENDWDHNVEADAAEGPVGIKTGKAPGPPDVSLELIAASGGAGIQMMAEICLCSRWIWNAS